jgi:predicted nucleic acid-binding protein
VNHNLRPKDALHIACAIDAGCDYFITTDDKITNKKTLIDEIEIVNPVNLINIIEEPK